MVLRHITFTIHYCFAKHVEVVPNRCKEEISNVIYHRITCGLKILRQVLKIIKICVQKELIIHQAHIHEVRTVEFKAT